MQRHARSSLTQALSPSAQDLAVSFQDESHFLKNIKTARCRAAMPILKVSPAENRLEAGAHPAQRSCCILLRFQGGPRRAGAVSPGPGALGCGRDLR